MNDPYLFLLIIVGLSGLFVGVIIGVQISRPNINRY